jgi:hypothetical protein
VPGLPTVVVNGGLKLLTAGFVVCVEEEGGSRPASLAADSKAAFAGFPTVVVSEGFVGCAEGDGDTSPAGLTSFDAESMVRCSSNSMSGRKVRRTCERREWRDLPMTDSFRVG